MATDNFNDKARRPVLPNTDFDFRSVNLNSGVVYPVVATLPLSVLQSLGVVDNVTTFDKFGYHSATTTERIVSEIGLVTLPSSAGVISVVSTSNNDVNSTGSGAWTCIITGLDENWDVAEETVNLNGTNAVTTSGNFIRINRAYVTGADESVTGGANDGDISLNIGGSLVNGISGNRGQTQTAVFSNPRNTRGNIRRWGGSCGSGKEVVFTLKTNQQNGGNNIFRVRRSKIIYQSPFDEPLEFPLVFEEKSDIVITSQTQSGSADSSAFFDVIYSNLTNQG